MPNGLKKNLLKIKNKKKNLINLDELQNKSKI